jgi:hypothetical protein
MYKRMCVQCLATAAFANIKKTHTFLSSPVDSITCIVFSIPCMDTNAHESLGTASIRRERCQEGLKYDRGAAFGCKAAWCCPSTKLLCTANAEAEQRAWRQDQIRVFEQELPSENPQRRRRVLYIRYDPHRGALNSRGIPP